MTRNTLSKSSYKSLCDWLYRMIGLNPLSREQIEEGLTRGVPQDLEQEKNISGGGGGIGFHEVNEPEYCEDCGGICTGNDCPDNEEGDLGDIITSFTFTIDDKGRLFIDGSWCESTDHMADIIAQFLFLLNEGNLKAHIAQYFLNSQKELETLEQKKFIHTIMEKWATLMKVKDDKENEPVIKPSRAFAMNKEKTTNLEETETMDE